MVSWVLCVYSSCQAAFVTTQEGGLFCLKSSSETTAILCSDLPQAVRFADWLTDIALSFPLSFQCRAVSAPWVPKTNCGHTLIDMISYWPGGSAFLCLEAAVSKWLCYSVLVFSSSAVQWPCDEGRRTLWLPRVEGNILDYIHCSGFWDGVIEIQSISAIVGALQSVFGIQMGKVQSTVNKLICSSNFSSFFLLVKLCKHKALHHQLTYSQEAPRDPILESRSLAVLFFVFFASIETK